MWPKSPAFRNPVSMVAAALTVLLGSVSCAQAFEMELKRAAMAVYLGTASPQQLALVRRSNDVVNRMAATGHMPDKVYQKLQSDFSTFNKEVASAAAGRNGLDLDQQVAKKAPTPGTDSDYLTKSKTGRMSVEQVKTTIADYNADMNKRLGTTNVDYSKKLNTDFMANQNQMSAEDFKEVGKLNNDAYKRQGSASYEAKVREPGSTVTIEETFDYQRDMNDLISKKKAEIKGLQTDIADAYKRDPSGLSPEVQDLKARLQIRQQQQAKYIERYADAAAATAKRYGVATPDQHVVDEIVKPAADRSIAPADGASQKQIADANRTKAAASSSLEGHVTQQVKTGAANVNVEAANKLGKSFNTLPEREMLLKNAAKTLSELPPSAQGDVIEDVRRRLGDKAAAELTAKTRELNSPGTAAKPKPGLSQDFKSAGAKVMQLTQIASVATDIRDWASGEKSNLEMAEAAANMVSQGYYNIGKELAGWKQAQDANEQAFVNNKLARVLKIATDLRRAGVSREDVQNIVTDLESGSESSLDDRIKDLNARGVAYTKPAPVERTPLTDRSWSDYMSERKDVVIDMAKGMVLSPVKLAWQTGHDVGELTAITTDIFKTYRNIDDTSLEIIEQINGINQRKLAKRLVELGATADEAKAAVEAWGEGKPEGLQRLHKLRDKLKSAALPPGTEQDSAVQPAPADPAQIEQRRAHIVERLSKLSHAKLAETLKALDVTPPADFYHCLCKGAGYGSSSTRQYYHPGTIGEFNAMYSCSQPGDPCVVEGYGCFRNPLPSDPKVWEGCLASQRIGVVKDAAGNDDPNSGERLDARIEQALRSRNAR